MLPSVPAGSQAGGRYAAANKEAAHVPRKCQSVRDLEGNSVAHPSRSFPARGVRTSSDEARPNAVEGRVIHDGYPSSLARDVETDSTVRPSTGYGTRRSQLGFSGNVRLEITAENQVVGSTQPSMSRTFASSPSEREIAKRSAS
jgi:hypothetical protein